MKDDMETAPSTTPKPSVPTAMPAGLPMPSDGATPSPGSHADQPLPPPPNFGRQVMQLVVIPAAIVVVCITLAFLFGKLAGSQSSVETYLLKLKQSSGAGKLAFGLQDPRYKDRGLAAYNIATMIPRIKDPLQRQHLGDELVQIMKRNVEAQEDMIQAYLLLALGQLGQEGGLAPILEGFQSPQEKVRQAAVGGVLMWPDRARVKAAVPALRKALEDASPTVSAQAAAALGAIAEVEDAQTLAALRQAMTATGLERREIVWNAAVALARLDDALGVQFVVEVLLDRQALARESAVNDQGASEAALSDTAQDRIMLRTLEASAYMLDLKVWDKINDLASRDRSRVVRDAARELLRRRDAASAG
ncbi:MAG: HEAT repeat domain-containing protein [Phycisphaeraceae bacterium]|nr:HEAT repeat domain-containing protein [Phycisphaeraceae bacterium]